MRKFIGDKAFYRRLFTVMLPIVIQQGITNFVGLLDNIMVGQVGTEQMSGVAITNQLLFVFQLCIFGILSGAGIFCAQYYGKGDKEKFQSVVRYKIISVTIITALGTVIFWTFREPLIRMFLNDSSSSGDLEATLHYGQEYLKVMLIGLVPFAIVQFYSSTMRETGETAIPMVATMVSLFANMGLNYVLIFGRFGAPRLGVVGAAIATVIARFVELIIIAVAAHKNKKKFPYFVGLYKTLKVPISLAKEVTIKGTPLMINEFLWSLGTTMVVQCYSMRGLDAVAAYNISSTVANFFSMAVFSMGTSISILVGQELGTGDFDRAVDTNRKMIFAGVILCGCAAILLSIAAPYFPLIYNTTAEIRATATSLLLLDALFLIPRGIYNNCYFTLRSGGKTLITFLFDSCSLWLINLPVALAFAHLTGLPLINMYLVVQLVDSMKAIVGLILVKKRTWVNNLAV